MEILFSEWISFAPFPTTCLLCSWKASRHSDYWSIAHGLFFSLCFGVVILVGEGACLQYVEFSGQGSNLSHIINNPGSLTLSLHHQGNLLLWFFFLSFFFFFFFFFGLCKATPTAFGSAQARDRIRAEAASLHHSHSSTGSKPHLQPTHSSQQCQIHNPLVKARGWTLVLMDTSQVHYHWATTGTPFFLFLLNYSWFTILCWFQVFIKVIPFFRFFSIKDYYKILNIIPCAIQ